MNENDELIEYVASIVPGAKVECAGCPVERLVSQCVVRNEKFYHSEECADRANAVVKKPQPKGVRLNGWDI